MFFGVKIMLFVFVVWIVVMVVWRLEKMSWEGMLCGLFIRLNKIFLLVLKWEVSLF